MRRLLKLTFLGFFLIVGIGLMANPNKIVFGAEDANSYPFSLKDKSGLNNVLLQMVSKNIGIPIEVRLYPWKRCLETLGMNSIDGVFAASFKEKRKIFGVYPTLENGEADASKRLHMGTYSIFVKDASKITWDGKKIQYIEKNIGAPAGYSIVSKLKGYGIDVYEAPSTNTLFKMLEKDRVSAVATLALQGQSEIAAHSEFSTIQELEPPLVSKPYYLMFSHEFSSKYPELTKKIYDEIEKVRNSKSYKDAVRKFFD